MQENIKTWLESYFMSAYKCKDFNYIVLPKSLALIYKIFIEKKIFYFKTLKFEVDGFCKESSLIIQLRNQIPDLIQQPTLVDLKYNWVLSENIPNDFRVHGLDQKIQIIRGVLSELKKVKNLNLKIKDKHFLLKNLESIQNKDELFSLAIFKKILHTLSNIDYPVTTIHGDLAFNNILTCKGDVKVIDWTDCCYSYNIIDFIFLEFFDPIIKNRAYGELLGYNISETEFKDIEIIISVFYLITYYKLKKYAVNHASTFLRYKDRIIQLLV